jgi:hypothetical protein
MKKFLLSRRIGALLEIVQIVLTNPEMMNLMKNYRERGLKKIE